MTSIERYAFSDCSKLTSVTIGNGVIEIGESAFYGCSKLTSVHITDIASWCKIKGLNVFGASPLWYAKHLFINGKEVSDLSIPNSVTTIGCGAFYGWSKLTSVTIPNSVTRIFDGAFSGCSGLTSIEIPNSVTSIEEYVFHKCSGLASVTIPNSIISIGNYAFYDCSSLTSIEIPHSVTNIGGWAFLHCSGLTSVTIPNSVKSVGNSAFGGCNGLISVTIPNSVTSIGDYAFQNCQELTDVYSYAKKVPSTGKNAFKDSYTEYATLYVPRASIEAYKTTAPWSGFGNFKAIEDVTGVNNVSTDGNGIADGKYFKDGRLVIVRGGKEYNAAGVVKK